MCRKAWIEGVGGGEGGTGKAGLNRDVGHHQKAEEA